ncbi:MAG: carboxypeptidase regulatory-like domain-containing protein [Candidatus Acidiferrales bacterium]
MKAIRFTYHSHGARLLSCLGIIALLFVFPLLAAAQDSASISGTVTDKTGASVVGAQIVISSVGGNLTRSTITNSEGVYVATALPAGSYDVTVTAPGFQRYQAKGVKLDVAQKAGLDVLLTIGSVTEVVEVTGESVAQVDTQSAEVGSTVTGKQVGQLVLNGRNFTQLVTLTPGVVSQTGQDEGTVGVNGNVAYSFNGGRTEYNNWEIDGGDNMDNGSNATLNVYPNAEAIAEFKVLTSNYGAQYGRNGSGTVEVETKSGTNAFHGSAFEYLRNDAFNARPWESGSDPTHPNPPYKKHDFGYTVGGPVYIPKIYNTDKKKTFFFWSQEWRREKNPHAYNVKVPTDLQRGGNFSELCPASGVPFLRASADSSVTTYPDCPAASGPDPNTGMFTGFANNQVPVDPNAQYLLAVLPHANSTDGGSYSSSVSLPTTWREELIRVDHNITDNYRLTFRYIHDSWSSVVPGPLWALGTSSFPNIQTNFVGPGTSFVARLTSNFSPTLLNEFVASYTADKITLSAVGPVALPSGFSMPPLFANGFEGKLPAFSFGGNGAYGGIADGTDQGNTVGVDTGYFPWKNANPTYTYRDNMTKIVRNHTLQFGVYFAAAQKNQENSANQQGMLTFNSGSPNSTGNSFADMLAGNIASYSQVNTQILFYDRYKIFEPYFQDDWRVTRRLTLNLGLRWSIFGRYQEKKNQEYGFDPAKFVQGNAPGIFIDPNNSSNPNTGALVDPVSGEFLTLSDPRVFNGYVRCGVSPTPTGCLKNKWINPAPRLGFAYDPKGNGKTAIRGGFGIFFEHENGNEANAEVLQQGAAPNSITSTQNNITGYGNVGGGLAFPVGPYSIPSVEQWPYVEQWNLGVQHELPRNFAVSVAYVGSKGTHLTLERDLNQLPAYTGQNPFAAGQPIDPNGGDCNFTTDPVTGLPTAAALGNGTVVPQGAIPNLWVACQNLASPLRPYRGFGTIQRIDTSANSIYNALQVTAKRTVGALTFSLAYTYSHSIDDSSDRGDTTFVDSYNPARNRASSNFDMRQNLALSYVYSLPFFHGAGLAHAVLGGWQISGITIAQTGTPVTITNGTTYGDNAGAANGLGSGSYPDLAGDPHAITATQKTAAGGVFGPLYYNPAAYVLPTGLTFGNSGRNTLNLPGRLNFDFGLFKRFAINERTGFDFRWETFNLFNHTQFNAMDTTMDCTAGANNSAGDASCIANSSFLHLTGAHAPRRMQFGLRFYF